MKHNPFIGCSTYIFVILAMLVSFTLISAAVAVSAAARKTSANYRRFASLYDIGLSACERMKLLLYKELEDKKDVFSEELARRLKDADNYENGLIFDGGKFIIGDNHLNIFRDAREKIVKDLLKKFTFASSEYSFRYHINSGKEVYNISVNAELMHSDNINVRVNVGKHGENFSIMPINIFGRIQWERKAGSQAELIPISYGWRDSPPDWFKNAQSPNEIINLDLTDLESKDAIHIVADGNINFNADMFGGEPAIVINPHSHPIHLHGNTFRGVIITKSDIVIDTLAAEGSIIAGGEISGTGVTASPDILFEIEADEATRRILYDVLGITNFAASGGSAFTILKDIKIKNFEIEPVNLFEPVLVGVQQV